MRFDWQLIPAGLLVVIVRLWIVRLRRRR